MQQAKREKRWLMDQQKTYHSYLLRLWTVEEGGQVSWRAMLEHAGGGQRMGFRSLARLFAYLEDQTASPCASPCAGDESDVDDGIG